MSHFSGGTLHIYYCIINLVFFELLTGGVQTADVVEESDTEIYKLDLSYYQHPVGYSSYPTTPAVYPSYAPAPTYAAPPPVYYSPSSYSYCAPEARSTQPPECDSLDEPLSGTSTAKNCTCTFTNSPRGCTLRMCTTADTCGGPCNLFSCICNGPTASPNYCVEVVPYPSRAVVPFTPTPAGDPTVVTTVNGFTHAHTHLNGVNTLQSQALRLEANRVAKEQGILNLLALGQPQASPLQTQGLLKVLTSL